MKPVLEIHHITNDLFNLPLERFLLTFDDGYQDQFQHFFKFLEIPTPKIYFIVPIWLKNPGFIDIDQLHFMKQHHNVQIGAHGYAHPYLKEMPLEQKIQEIHQDTELMINWFRDNLGFTPTKFCFPFNYRVYGIYERILRDYGFTEFYGDERIRLGQLMNSNWHKWNCLW